jgi:diguanylate cyclase (GGDEF)-like protein
MQPAPVGESSSLSAPPPDDGVPSLLRYTTDVVNVVGPAGEIRYTSPAGRDLLADLGGRRRLVRLQSLAHPADADRVRLALTRASVGRGPVGPVDWRVRDHRGSWRHLESTFVNALDDPFVGGIVITSHDVTERVATAAQMHHRAFHDSLTGLPNRALLRDRLDQALHRAERSGHFVAVLYLDLDRFKVINDSLGHPAGDQVLIDVADRLSRAVRPGDTVARLGGDEFVVLAEAVGGHAEAEGIAERIRQALLQPITLHGGGSAVVTTSIGITLSRHAGSDSALRDADTALYRAKERGRDRHQIFDEGLRHRAVQRLDTEQLLRRALDTSEFVLYYQPIIELETGRITGNEALLRISDGNGLILPEEFVSVAEESGLIVTIGAGVIGEACRQAVRWREDLGADAPARVTVNVSGRQLSATGIVEQVRAAMARSGATGDMLCLELTEGVLIEAGRSTLAALDELKEMGITLGIDDFGTGYSSLSYLKRFPVDFLKVDRSFIRGLGQDPEDTVIVRAVVALGQSLGLATIAEGVETQIQLEALQQLGCDMAQGYYFARPMAADDLVAHLRRDPVEAVSPDGRVTSPDGRVMSPDGRVVSPEGR